MATEEGRYTALPPATSVASTFDPAAYLRAARAASVGTWTRCVIAGNQIVGGVLLLVAGAVPSWHHGAQWWLVALFEALGVSAIIAGGRLWRNEPSGFWMSIILLAIQSLQLSTARFAFSATAGPLVGIRITGAPYAVTFLREFAGSLNLVFGGTGVYGGAVNVYAVVACFVLLAMRDEQLHPVPDKARGASRRTESGRGGASGLY